jgi:type IV pilus assembly protein PilY1
MMTRAITQLQKIGVVLFGLLWMTTDVMGVEFSVTPLNAPVSPPPNILFSMGLDYNAANTAAYLGDFDNTMAYDGYFDPNKCYEYYFTSWTLPGHYFNPVYTTSLANHFACGGSGQRAWSGAFMNWLTMTKVDLLRKNLTGGTRTYDTKDMTLLMRSWLDGRGPMTNFPDRYLSADTVKNYTGIAVVKPYIIANLSPSNWGLGCRNDCNSREALGDSFRIIDPSDPSEAGKNILNNSQLVPPVVVKVCDTTVSLENNCAPYYQSNGIQYYKPVGVLQRYSNLARFGIAGYPPFDGPQFRAGGVVFEPLKSIGSLGYSGKNVYSNNSVPEIDPITGVYIYDPDGLYTQQPKSSHEVNPVYKATNMGNSWSNSGVMNYINLFGYRHGLDNTIEWSYPAGATSAELFYESIRYFSLSYSATNDSDSTSTGSKTVFAPTPEYTQRISDKVSFNQLKGNLFLVPSTYSDPVQDLCQRNAVVFIGSVNQDCDSRIPGGVNHAEDGRCVKWNVTPSSPISGLDTSAWINQLGLNEGGGYTYENLVNHYINVMSCPDSYSTGRGCWNPITPNIMGLSYWAHVNDIRSDLDGFQSITSYFMDWKSPIGRNQDAMPGYSKDPTQYWLAAKYGGFSYKSGQSINPNDDSTTWDNGSGTPKTFLRFDTPENLQTDLNLLFSTSSDGSSVNHIDNLLGNSLAILQSNGRIALSQSSNPQDTRVYQAIFARQGSNMWEGNLLKNTPSISSSDGNTVSYNTLGQNLNFTTSAAGWLKDNTVNGHARKVIAAVRQTASGTVSGTPFIWSSLGGYAQSILSGGDSATRGEQRVNYVRGDRSNEFATNNPNGFRKRADTVLGDIIDSSPVFVGPAVSGYSDSDFPSGTASYNSFVQAMGARKPMVYVGANDGMLHGFDAVTMEEVFAFIPNSVLTKFVNFSSQGYVHDFFVNETPIISEVPISDRGWSTVLIGFPGAGGSGLFALDVTTPNDNSRNANLSNAENNANNILLWELNNTTDKDIGNILNRGQINRQRGFVTLQAGKMSNGRWAVVTGNGYNAPNNSTGLLVVYLDVMGGTPQYQKVMIPGVSGGLSTPTPVDIDRDGIIDFAYAGDLQGNVWRFDLRGAANTWSAFKLFQATELGNANSPQPIMQAPAVTYHCQKNGYMVIVGTGKYFEPTDNQIVQKSSVYGLWDDLSGNKIVLSSLVEQTFSATTIARDSSLSVSGAKSYITSSNNDIDWTSGKRGWVVNMNDKILMPPYIVDNMVNFNTIYFDAPSCGTPRLWPTLYALQSCTGKRPDRGVFDVNYNGKIDPSDQVDGGIYVSGMSPDSVQRIFDPSIWIYPTMLHCSTPTCPTVQTGLSEFIGVDLGTVLPKRLSWKELDQ